MPPAPTRNVRQGIRQSFTRTALTSPQTESAIPTRRNGGTAASRAASSARKLHRLMVTKARNVALPGMIQKLNWKRDIPVWTGVRPQT